MRLRTAVLLVAIAAGASRGDLTIAHASIEDLAAPAQRSQRVTLRSDDGTSIAATWYEPPSRPAPAVVLVHTLTRSRREWDLAAGRLAAEGIGALALDLRGHGESSGDASNLAAMVNDVKAAKRHLAVRPDVIHSRIGVAGTSIGANLAALAAADEPAIASLVLLSPSLDYRGLRIEAALRKYGGRPVLMVAGTDDGYGMRSVKELSKTGAGTREVLLLDDAGHGMNMFTRAPELATRLVDWFHRTLQ